MRSPLSCVAAVVIACFALQGSAWAKTLAVGSDAEWHTLGDALAQAHDGDTISLAPGEYYECAQIRVSDLVLQGAGDGTVITDKTCYGKGLLVVQASGVKVRDLTLARARVADGNGAGIRLEAGDLLVERVRFVNNQVGILAGQAGTGAVIVRDCTFRDGGVAGERPSAALLVAGVGRLLVEHSTFSAVKGGQISSGAARTELLGNRIETGVEPGAGYDVLLTGGDLLMRDNVLAIGPNTPPRNAAVLVIDGTAEMHANRLENATGHQATLLLDWGQGTPVLSDNVLGAGDDLWGREGLLRHRAGNTARAVIGEAKGVVRDARGLFGAAKQGLKGLLGR